MTNRRDDDDEHGARASGQRRLVRGAHTRLEIDASDSAKSWREFIEAIEELARQGETIDCVMKPVEHHRCSSRLRAAVQGKSSQCHRGGAEQSP